MDRVRGVEVTRNVPLAAGSASVKTRHSCVMIVANGQCLATVSAAVVRTVSAPVPAKRPVHLGKPSVAHLACKPANEDPVSAVFGAKHSHVQWTKCANLAGFAANRDGVVINVTQEP
ncbi:MAG: hypothetical protein CMH52_06205 [Myxococcales bacterium]|nr:hypothetical protein [Myxococcales bacterium]